MAIPRVFGPVPSRRLGLSLGVDLLPLKTCTLDCVYCQLGSVGKTTLDRGDLLPIEGIVDEVLERIERGPTPNYITLSGSGEPTLHTGMGSLIDRLRSRCDVPVAILTNGTLLRLPEVREACLLAHLLVPSLDAGDEDTFQSVNRPHGDLPFDHLVEGLIKTGEERTGNLWLEVFLVKGVNNSPQQLERIGALADRVAPDRIDVNTAARPAAEDFVSALSPEELRQACQALGPMASDVQDYQRSTEGSRVTFQREEILTLLQRRPCTAEDVASGLAIHVHEALKVLSHLVRQGYLEETRQQGRTYYRQRTTN